MPVTYSTRSPLLEFNFHSILLYLPLSISNYVLKRCEAENKIIQIAWRLLSKTRRTLLSIFSLVPCFEKGKPFFSLLWVSYITNTEQYPNIFSVKRHVSSDTRSSPSVQEARERKRHGHIIAKFAVTWHAGMKASEYASMTAMFYEFMREFSFIVKTLKWTIYRYISLKN